MRAYTALISASTVLLFVEYNDLFHLSRGRVTLGKTILLKGVLYYGFQCSHFHSTAWQKVIILQISLVSYRKYTVGIGVIEGYFEKS